MKNLFAFIMAVFLGACSSEQEVLGDHSSVLATYSGGEITLGQLDQFIIKRNRNATWTPPDSVWYQNQVKRLAVEQLLSESDPDSAQMRATVAARMRVAVRQRTVARYLARQAEIVPDQEAVRRHYDENLARFDLPERRVVSHIYLRIRPDRAKAEVRERLEELRQMAVSGVPFSSLAREHSDSESRHQDGHLGLLTPGKFTSDFDQVVFNLTEGEVSAPVTTAAGGHLFLVTDILAPRKWRFEEVALSLGGELREMRLREKLEQSALEILAQGVVDAPPITLIERLAAMQRLPEILFRIGDHELTREDFLSQLQQRRAEPGGNQAREGPELLRSIYFEEIVYQSLLSDESDSFDDDELGAMRSEILNEVRIQQAVEQFVDSNPELLKSHYDRQGQFFSQPASVILDMAIVPINDRAVAVMAALEDSVADLDAGRMTLKQVADQHNGTIVRTPSLTLQQLQASDPTAVNFAFVVAPGNHSPPYTLNDKIVIFRVVERKESQIIPFEAARPAVRDHLLSVSGPDIYEAMANQVLNDADFQTLPVMTKVPELLALLPSS